MATSLGTGKDGNAATHEHITHNASSPKPPDGDGEAFAADEESALKELTEHVRDQDDLERDISMQANMAIIEAEDKKDQKRIERAELTKSRFENQKKIQQQKLRAASPNPTAKLRIQQEIARIDAEIEICDKDISDFNVRIEQRHNEPTFDELSGLAGGGRLPTETQREYLIRTGKITPFAKVGGPKPDGVEGGLADALIDAEVEAVAQALDNEEEDGPRSHQNLRRPGFAEDLDTSSAVESEFSLRPRKKRKLESEVASDEDWEPSAGPSDAASLEFDDADEEESEDYDLTDMTPSATRKSAKVTGAGKVDLSGIDDGNESVYQRRLADWVDRRSRARHRQRERLGLDADVVPEDNDEEEWYKPSPDHPDHVFENGLKLPGDIYPSLFDYQKTGVQWLAELYAQKVGGIVGDEMGLGKTGRFHWHGRRLDPRCSQNLQSNSFHSLPLCTAARCSTSQSLLSPQPPSFGSG